MSSTGFSGVLGSGIGLTASSGGISIISKSNLPPQS